MRIKIITCHDVYNNGASLQSYALQNYLSSEDHDVEIIDYKPDYLSNHYKFLAVSNPTWRKNILLRIIYILLKFPNRFLSLKKKRVFDKFRNDYLRITKERYISNDELKANPPIADLFIAGSDQIWNTLYKNGRDKAFYLDFVPDGCVKASYAASFATNHVLPEFKDLVREGISGLDYISVRESSGLSIINNLGIDGAVCVCDPVFLLTKESWLSIINEEFNEDYILIYDFEQNDIIEAIAIKLAKKNNCKIYVVNTKLDYADRCFPYAGPQQFISLIKHAKFVISNSFHGTAFSLIFQIPFFVVQRNEDINSRMIDLLSRLELSNRIVTSYIDLPHIDWTKVRCILDENIVDSKAFLRGVLDRK